MRYYYFPAVFLLVAVMALLSLGGSVYAQDSEIGQQIDKDNEAIDVEEEINFEDVLDVIEPEIGLNPQRAYCAKEWTERYERQKAEIKVTTRGEYDEIAVIDCPTCSLEDHFVKPFLESEYRGKTGYMRLQECGFVKVIFEGFRGIQEVALDVPQVFPNPDRVRCAVDWNERYEKLGTDVRVVTRGDYNEQIVFICARCTNKESFINPFLRTEFDENGNTAMDKMSRCGFHEVVFTNLSETRTVVKEVR